MKEKDKRKKGKVLAANLKKRKDESRRDLLKHLAFLPFLGGFAWLYGENRKFNSPDGFSGSTIVLKQESLKNLIGEMPKGVLAPGKPPISRMILGANILSGTAHARDLIYASQLFRAYNTEKKIIETYLLAEQAGINLFYLSPLLNTYRQTYKTNIQTWTNVDPRGGNVKTLIDRAVDQGVDYIFVMGAAVDQLVREEKFDMIAESIDYIRQQGRPAGLGAHAVQAMMACDREGIEPDFYYKTMHHDRYWSAIPKHNRIYPMNWKEMSDDHDKFNDNMWCWFPEETIEFVRNAKKPVVGYKVLAAGAIKPEVGFQWAFDNGADFIDVGMFDFQIVANVNQVIRSVEQAKDRERPWFG